MEEELHLEVDAAMQGTRIDRLLAERFPHITRSRFQKLLRDGCVTARGKRVRSAYRVLLGDPIRIRVPPPEPLDLVPRTSRCRSCTRTRISSSSTSRPGSSSTPRPATTPALSCTRCSSSTRRWPSRRASGRPGIVHRLDKGTSGLMVVAKTEQAHVQLATALRAREVQRRYVALVWGRVARDSGSIEGAIGRSPADRKKMAVVARGGKAARTHWEVRGALAILHPARRATGDRAHAPDPGPHGVDRAPGFRRCDLWRTKFPFDSTRCPI
jgi:23S rRNA pseudouridine1911/1915/1917 synthase